MRGTKINFNEIQLVITYNPTILCLKETHLKENDTLDLKHYMSYNHKNKQANIEPQVGHQYLSTITSLTVK